MAGKAPAGAKADDGGRQRTIILIGGPTASGKSAAALALAVRLGGVVINADSMQVYRDLRVLTARPGDAELTQAPHCLDGVLDAADICSAGRWQDLALAEMVTATDAGQVPIVVGGTGLYLRGLVHGMAPVPPIPPKIRADVRAFADQVGTTGLASALAAEDPEMARRLQPTDPQRQARALEVIRATGQSLLYWQRQTEVLPDCWRIVVGLLAPDRTRLYQRCDRRLDAMLERGAVEEVDALTARGLPADTPLLKALGASEIAAWRAGQTNRDDAVTRTQQLTRNFAKRQLTWFRRQSLQRTGDQPAVIAQDPDTLWEKIITIVRNSH
jgi:tRNA dimethylallyltransferase